MIPPVFSLANADAPTKSALGTSPLRLWPFGESPQNGAPGYAEPYAVWQSIAMVPENYLGQVPDTDGMSVQLDVYGTAQSDVRTAATALRNLYQQHGYVAFMREWPRETDTKLYRFQLDVDFHQYR